MELVLHETVVLVAISMIVSEDLQSLLFLTLADEITRRLRCKEYEEEL